MMNLHWSYMFHAVASMVRILPDETVEPLITDHDNE